MTDAHFDGGEAAAPVRCGRRRGQQDIVDEEVVRGAHRAPELKRREQLREETLRGRLRQLTLLVMGPMLSLVAGAAVGAIAYELTSGSP